MKKFEKKSAAIALLLFLSKIGLKSDQLRFYIVHRTIERSFIEENSISDKS